MRRVGVLRGHLAGSFTEIPTIDLRRALHDPAPLLAACRDVGVFYVTLPDPADQRGADQLLQIAGEFFSMPEPTKRRVHFDNSPHWRGFAPCGDEVTAGGQDMREQLDIGNEEPSQLSAVGRPGVPEWVVIKGPNQWPPEPAGLQRACVRHQQAMRRVSDQLAAALEGPKALGLPAGTFAAMFGESPYTRMKVVNYPSRSRTRAHFPTAEYGCGPHKDYMLWGFLLQGESDQAVLQVQNNMGMWVDAPVRPNTLVCSLGEMFELATRGMFKATTHRVLMPSHHDRLSVNWFIGPHLAFAQPPEGLPISEATRERYAARVDRVRFDGRAGNSILSVCGDNMLKGMIRSHPVMARAHHPELFLKYGYQDEHSKLFH